MAELFAGNVSEFDEENRKLITHNGRDIVVLQHQGQFYAYENYCLHAGGPVGEGVIIGKVEAILDENMNCLGERFSKTEMHLVCPWHGWEYEIETGVCAANRRRKLQKYETVQRGQEVYVLT